MPYLMLDDAEKFLDFTTSVLGAKVTHKAVNDDGTLGHCEIMIGDSTIMFSNSREEWPSAPMHLFVYVEDGDASYQKALGAGAESVMEMDDKPYGRSGGVKDQCGVTWWITEAPQ